MATRLGRPKDRYTKTATFRLKESEWEDLRKCAIASGETMADWLRNQIRKYKRTAKTAGRWPDSIERD